MGEVINSDRFGEICVENLLFSHIVALFDDLALGLTDLSPIVERSECKLRGRLE